MKTNYVPEGVIPAVLLPFDAQLRIDEAAYRGHLRDVLAVDGITALTVNGHSQEIHALSTDEQKRVLAIAVEEAADKVPVICGVYADSPDKGAKLAKQAENNGAEALLIFPTNVFMLGSVFRPEMVIEFHRIIGDASALPMITFVYAASTGMGYATDTLVKLAGQVPQVVAIKDGCGNPVQHERNIRVLHGLARPLKVISTHSNWLMSSLVMGVDGLLSGAGSVIADLQVELWRAVKAKILPWRRRLTTACGISTMPSMPTLFLICTTG